VKGGDPEFFCPKVSGAAEARPNRGDALRSATVGMPAERQKVFCVLRKVRVPVIVVQRDSRQQFNKQNLRQLRDRPTMESNLYGNRSFARRGKLSGRPSTSNENVESVRQSFARDVRGNLFDVQPQSVCFATDDNTVWRVSRLPQRWTGRCGTLTLGAAPFSGPYGLRFFFSFRST